MGKGAKATRKFEKKHLKDTLERRKDFAKVKQRHRSQDKKKARRAKEEGQPDLSEEDAENGKESKAKGADAVDDEYFKNGVDIPERPRKAGKRAKAGEVTEKTGKRKRTDPIEDGDDGGSSSDSLEEDPLLEGSDSDSGKANPSMRKGDMDALAEKDPEFYKYLQENDAELLDFSDNNDLAEVDELSSGEEQEQTPKKKKKKRKRAVKEEEDDTEDNDVSMATVKKWKAAMIDMHSLRAMRQVVLAFRAAAHVNEEEGKEYKYSISSADVYHELLILALRHVPEVLNHHLPVKESASGKIRVATDSKKFRTLTPLLKSHTASVHHLLSNLSDAATLKLTLSSIDSLLPYLLSFKKLLRNLARSVVAIWSDASSSEATRINAFLVVRRLAVIGDSGLRETVLKTVYQGLVKGSRNTSIHTMPGINLMKNSAAELWGLDPSIGYTTGFTFIRQLAIHLRSSITNPTKESYKTVYNWQYVHSLDFWSRVLSTYCTPLAEATSTGADSPLRPLIYPTVQITLGALRLIPTATYFPLRFQLTRSLLRVARSTGTYIPLAPSLLEVFDSTALRKPPKPSTLKPLDFAHALRAPHAYLGTRTYQDGLGALAAELLAEFFADWAKSIAFPELALPVCVMLKRWLKRVSRKGGTGPPGSGAAKPTGNRNGKVNALVALLVQKLEANARWVEERRARVPFAPSDRAGVEGFLKDVEWETSPLGAYVVGMRRAKEERERVVEEGRKEDARRGKGGRGKGDEDEEEEVAEETFLSEDEDGNGNEDEDEEME